MTGTIKIKLTARKISFLSHRHYAKENGLKCYKCQRSFNIGETIVPKSRPRKYYCLQCAKTLNLI